MKKILCLTSLMLFIAVAAHASDVKIGYVDLQKIVTTSQQGKEAMKTLDSIEKAKNALIKEKVSQIRKIEEEVAKQGALLTEEAKQKKQVEHDKLVSEFQQMKKDRDEELKKNEAVFIQKIILDIKKMLAKIAAEEGYIAILNDAGVVYIPEKMNLTDRVLNQFNEISSEKPVKEKK